MLTRALLRPACVTTDLLLLLARAAASIPIDAVAVVARFSGLHDAVAANGTQLDFAHLRATVPVRGIPVVTFLAPLYDAIPALGGLACIAAIVRIVLVPVIAFLVPFLDAVPALVDLARIAAIVRVVLVPVIAFLPRFLLGIATHGIGRQGEGINAFLPHIRSDAGHRARRGVRPVGLPAHVARLRALTVDG